jgi:hypothetical protein
VAAQPAIARNARRWVALAAAVLATGGLLSIATGHTVAAATAAPGTTTRVSVAEDGSQQTTLPGFFSPGSRNAAFSGDGRSVAFDTEFPFDAVDKDNDADPAPSAPARHESDVYARDRPGNHTVLITRGTPPPIVKLRVAASVAAAVNGEAGANSDSRDPSISMNGRYVAFTTSATNIHTVNPTAPGPDALHTEIVVCDRDPDNDGVFDEHVNGNPKQPMDYVYTVVSRVTTVVGPDPNPEDLFPGPTLRTNSASQPSLTIGGGFGEVAWVESRGGSVPPPDRVVVTRFALGATGLVQPAGMEFAETSPGRVVRGASDAGEPVLSRDGSHVAYTVDYDLGETSGRAVADAHLGELALPTLVTPGFFFAAVDQSRLDIASAAPDPQGNLAYFTGNADSPTISGNGRLVAFTEWTLNPDDTVTPDIVLIDRDPDADGAFVLAESDGRNNGEPVGSRVVSHDNADGRGSGYSSALTPDGRYIGFSTNAPNMHNGVDDASGDGPCNVVVDLVAAPVSTCADVVVRDLTVDDARAATAPPLARLPGELASPSVVNDCGAPAATDTCEGNGDSRGATITDDGSAIAYESGANDLLPAGVDTNGLNDIFVHEFQPTVTGDPVDFGTMNAGSTAERTAVVRHTGFGPLLIDSVALGGANPGDFTVLIDACTTSTAVPMHETDVCGVSLRFTATVPPGKRQATLTVTPHGRNPLVIPITAEVTVPPVDVPPVVPPDGFRASPNPMSFGQRLPLSPSGPATLTVSNAGRLPLTVGSVTRPAGGTLFPDDYTISRDTCAGKTVPVGGSCTLKVTFTPHAAGTRNGALQVTTVQSGTSSLIPHLIALAGSSAAQVAQINPGVVVAGRVGVVTGQGFPPNHAVILTISDFGTLTVQTAADGSFTQSLVVFLHTTQGSRTVAATVPGTTVQATTTVLVVAGTFQPPDFASRR